MSDPRDYKLDIQGLASDDLAAASPAVGRAYLSVHFACCGAYQRIYRKPGALDYVGRCPRCGKTVRFAIGEGGTDVRSFVVE